MRNGLPGSVLCVQRLARPAHGRDEGGGRWWWWWPRGVDVGAGVGRAWPGACCDDGRGKGGACLQVHTTFASAGGLGWSANSGRPRGAGRGGSRASSASRLHGASASLAAAWCAGADEPPGRRLCVAPGHGGKEAWPGAEVCGGLEDLCQACHAPPYLHTRRRGRTGRRRPCVALPPLPTSTSDPPPKKSTRAH